VDLLNELREQLGFAMVFVSHDLALVASLAHRITVMYAGQVVESARASELLQNPKHEYTRGLLGAPQPIAAFVRWGGAGGVPSCSAFFFASTTCSFRAAV